jgi:phosphoenolpyruvate phosphomutase
VLEEHRIKRYAMKKKNYLKEKMKERKLMKIVGAHNGLTAKLVEEAGFDGVWASGFEISTSHAVPDANILTMTDYLHAAEDMVSTVTVPVIADCDTGYGNSNNVMQMVRRYEAAGVSAVCIEDKRFPKVNSFIAGRQELAPIAEFAGKIMAAKNTQTTDDFLVFARVEALIAGWGMDEALRRAEAYVESGADGIFIHSKAKSPGEIRDFCRAWNRRSPVLICPTTYDISEEEMNEMGINIVIYANHGIRAAIRSAQETLTYMKEHGPSGLGSKIVSMDEVFRLQGMYAMKDHEKKYLKSDAGTLKAIVPAAGGKIASSLDELLEDRPVGMLDINGKSLLQRNVDALNIAGVQDINIVVGYKGENVKVEGAKIIKNERFKDTGIMRSIIEGVDTVADMNLILYSDLLLDQYLIQNLMKKKGDIVLVVDSSYKKMNSRNKNLELVKTLNPTVDSLRVVDTNRKNPVSRIGKKVREEDAHYEFIGLALASKKGMEILKREYEAAGLPEPVSFVDFLQHMIDKGHEVLAYEVTSGWKEIHSMRDYKDAGSFFTAGER